MLPMCCPTSALGLVLLLPFLATVLIAFLPRRCAEPLSFVAALVTFLLMLQLLHFFNQDVVVSLVLGELITDLKVAFRVDGLGLTFGLLASGLWVLATVFSYGYVRETGMKHLARYFSCFALAIASVMGIAFAANLFTFLLFFEALTLATYPLVVHKETPEAIAAGRRYLAYSLTGGLLMTAGIIGLWNLTDSLDFRAGGFVEAFSDREMSLLFLVLISGCVVKAAVMPFHSWLPAAMVAPSPVSALLHAVAVVKAGVFGVLRMTGYVFKPELVNGSIGQTVMIVLTVTTIIVGSVMAVVQTNLKRRLAYSTIVHLSLIVLAAMLLSQSAYVGAMFHLVNHALAKITLFFCAGSIYATTRYTEISQLKGIGRRMPLTMIAFTIGALGLIGVPGFCGAVSKHYLVLGANDAGLEVLGYLMMGASLFTALYLLPIVYAAFFQKAQDEESATAQAVLPREARVCLWLPPLLTAALVIAFGSVGYFEQLQLGLADRGAAVIFETMIQN